MKIRQFYRYIRDNKKNPVTTLAFLPGINDEVVAIGAACCSPKDQFRYSIGRAKALGRAMRILKTPQPMAMAMLVGGFENPKELYSFAKNLAVDHDEHNRMTLFITKEPRT